MSEAIVLTHTVDGNDFTAAGTASSEVKKTLKQLGIPSAIIRKVSICMYEGEINMVIHADGGKAETSVYPDKIIINLKDTGPGIPDISLAMKEGYSTASDKARNLGFGAGMGLPNMKKWSDDMVVTSKVGEGTEITMTVNIQS